MANPTATKQYLIAPITSANVITYAVPFAALGAGTLHYYSVGKLYFGFYFVGGGGINTIFGSRNGSVNPTGDTQTTADYVASLLGLPTINTYYVGSDYFNGGGSVADHSTGSWVVGGGGVNGGFLTGFITN